MPTGKFRRNILFEQVDKTRQWSAQGCHSFSIYNAGNVNVTINKVLVLEPLSLWEGPIENPNVNDWSNIDIEFDTKNDPTGYTPVGGTAPPAGTVIPGDPPPPRDTRVVIFKSFLEAL